MTNNATTPSFTHTGNCHCGLIAFEVQGEIDSALACNCSLCSRRGSLLWFVPRSSLQLKTPEDAVATYTFHQHQIRHHFCPVCGIHPYGEATDPQGNAVAAINLRCVDGIDLAAIPTETFDGKSV